MLPYEKFEDTKGIIRSANRRTDNAMDKRKGTNNDLKNTAQKTKDRTKRTQLKTLGELRCSGSVSSSYSTSGTRSVTLVTNPLISHE
jgi:hypothetical protein